MIATNLKIGDVFTDGGRKYKVDGVCELGYISHAIDSTTETKVEVKVETKPESKEYSKTQINRLPLEELKKVCVEIGIEPMETGTAMKKAIIEKLAL